MNDDYMRVRKLYNKFTVKKDQVRIGDYTTGISDGCKQLAYCRRQLWKLERYYPKQPELLVSIQSWSLDVIVKLRQMAEQCIQRFAAEMILWPNWDQQQDSTQPISDDALKGLYGAITRETFDKAVRDGKLEPDTVDNCKMSLSTHYPAVRDALLRAQPFYYSSSNPSSSPSDNNTDDLLNPWWRLIIIISNICKHSRQLEVYYDDTPDRDELRIVVPLRGSKILSPTLFYDCFPGRTNKEILVTSELIYQKHKDKKWKDSNRFDLSILQTTLEGVISPEEQGRINDCLDGVYDKKSLVKDYSVCGLIRAALQGFRAVVVAIDESKKLTNEMHDVASTGNGSLRTYLDAGIPMDRLNLRRESCYHLCAMRGDLEQLQVLVEDKEALRRALFQQDREHKRTPLHHMYLHYFKDDGTTSSVVDDEAFQKALTLVRDNVDHEVFQRAMALQDKDEKTPDMYC